MVTRLIYCDANVDVIVQEVISGIGAVENLTNLGINLKDKISILEGYSADGPIKVSKNNTKIIIGRGLAEKILVDCKEEVFVPLSKILFGDIVEVVKMNSSGEIRYRLLDMGLVKGVKIKVLRVAPLGDPIEIEMKGFNISLRKNEAESILVKPIEIEKNKRKRFSLFS